MKHCALLLTLLSATSASATGFTDRGLDLFDRGETAVELDGALRLRGTAYGNLDLDRGLTPSGELLFPVPLADPGDPWLTHSDLRLRTDLHVVAPGGNVGVKLRVDVLDGLSLGSRPEGSPQTTTSQLPPTSAFVVKRAYGEVLLPFGYLAAGRMGSHFGLGMLANGGDCADCDRGDAADRVIFLTPLASHLFTVAYDLSSTGPAAARPDGRVVDLEPTDDVRAISFAVLNVRDELARERRRRADKTTFEYGVLLSHRWQERDVPSSWVPTSEPVAVDAGQLVQRGLSATALAGWARLTLPIARLELEAAVLHASMEQASVVPGVELAGRIEGTGVGAAFESELGRTDASLRGGLDLGFASGDETPGIGAFTNELGAAPKAGDLRGPQARAPHDPAGDEFRFHPDYRVDRILFRELYGTVVDALWVRPHVSYVLGRTPRGAFEAQLAVIGSMAAEPTSTVGGERPLGVELDPTISYESDDGLRVAFEPAVLFPLAGLDNPDADLTAAPAWLTRVHLSFGF